MKISVSNIAWYQDPKRFSEFLNFIKNLNCDGVEIAPSAIWDEPISSTKDQRNILKKSIKEFDLEFVGFHSLLFSKPNLKLFKDKNLRLETKKYIFSLIDLCSDLEGTKLIYGSPKSRELCGREYEDCKNQSLEDFYEIAEHSKKRGSTFCIEPLSLKETDFITSLEEGGEIVRYINHPNFKLHLDTKVLFGSKKDFKSIIFDCKDIIKHVHVGDENLMAPGTINKEHSEIGRSLREVNYKDFITLEMRRDLENIEGSIKKAIKFVQENYIKS